ncbi:hypothetical protein HHK36_033469 [Tetracentron sinense]|uniref:Uncharacterized protein n=1 Tax=Tetracentron sinense TaxID=13715 RepID=A0A834Y994_TETSI|nr:hypothetical protein HHK36_033469 [Tetracentron sinense]
MALIQCLPLDRITEAKGKCVARCLIVCNAYIRPVPLPQSSASPSPSPSHENSKGKSSGVLSEIHQIIFHFSFDQPKVVANCSPLDMFSNLCKLQSQMTEIMIEGAVGIANSMSIRRNLDRQSLSPKGTRCRWSTLPWNSRSLYR